VATSLPHGPPTADADMEVDLDGINFQQNNIQQNNYQQINFENTSNLQQVAVVGVDPNIALQLQQRAADAEQVVTQVAAAAEREVTASRQQAQEAQGQVARVSVEAEQIVNQTVSDGRAAVAAAQSETAHAVAAAQIAEERLRQAEARAQQLEISVQERVAKINAENLVAERVAIEEREALLAAHNRYQRGEGEMPLLLPRWRAPPGEPLPGLQASQGGPPRGPEHYDVSTPPDGLRTPDEFHSPIIRSPKSAAAVSSSAPLAPAESTQPSSDDRISRLENLFSSSLSALIGRIDAFTAKPISRPARRSSGKSPTRARGEAQASDDREAVAPGATAGTTNAATKPPAFIAGTPSKHGAHNSGPNGPGGEPPASNSASTEMPPLSCSNCGAIQVPNAAFCWKCGQPHIAIVTPPKATPTAVPRLYTKHCWSDPDPSDGEDDDEYYEEGEEEEEEDSEPDPVEDPPQSTPFCTSCGTQFPAGPGSNFCSVCGAAKPAADIPSAAAPGGFQVRPR
jgi:hypothetical protein